MKKSLEDDSYANKLLLESLKKKQIRDIFNLKDLHKDPKVLESLDRLLIDKKPKFPLNPSSIFPYDMTKNQIFSKENKEHFFKEKTMENQENLIENKWIFDEKKPENKEKLLLEMKKSTGGNLMPHFRDFKANLPEIKNELPSFLPLSSHFQNSSVANLESILLNLKTKSLEPKFLNLQGNKDSAFAILHFLGTMQSEISSYLYNLGMNSKQNNEAKFEQINNLFMTLGNSNIFNSFLFPHLHVNNNSNIFSKCTFFSFFFFLFSKK